MPTVSKPAESSSDRIAKRKPWGRSMWARRGSPVAVETFADGFRAVSVNTKQPIVVVGVQDDHITLRATLRRFGWSWNRRRAEYVRRSNVANPMPQPGRSLNWSSKRAILERIGGRCVMTAAQLETALASVARVADSVGSWLAPVLERITEADRSELLSECQACAVQDGGGR